VTIRAIIDTGPLVAFLDRRERHHAWVVDRIGELEAPLLVCEPVLVEATYLLGRIARAQDALMSLAANGALDIPFRLKDHVEPVRSLMRKYCDQPMSLADACIVRMAELYERHAVLTLDSDFLTYRKHGRAPLDLIRP
jgi:predicted nucleic acid-binding protein